MMLMSVTATDYTPKGNEITCAKERTEFSLAYHRSLNVTALNYSCKNAIPRQIGPATPNRA